MGGLAIGDRVTERERRAQLDAWWDREPLAFEARDERDGFCRFEFSSRGDRVEGWLRSAPGQARPLILLVPGSAAGAADPSATTWAHAWHARGAAVACLDLPLHGARASAKLSAALVEAAADLDRLEADPDRARLVGEFLRQSRWDLRGALGALVERPEIDATHCACVGVTLGALTGLHTWNDPRVGAAVFVEAPRGGPPGIDPSAALKRLGRPALLVERTGADGLAGEAERLPLPAAPEAAAAAIWPFLARALGL